MAQVTFEKIRKVYPDGTVAVKELSLEIPDGELMVFVGPSGCALAQQALFERADEALRVAILPRTSRRDAVRLAASVSVPVPVVTPADPVHPTTGIYP